MKCRFVNRTGDPSFSGATVVGDVMRAFTTAAWAFERGAVEIILVAEIADALALKHAIPGALAFCDGVPREGFDLFNSPAQLLDLNVAGRTIVQRTTAGTQGATASRHCSPLLCTGFVTAQATADYLRAHGSDEVCFVVTGGDEDSACAEYIAALLHGDRPDQRYLDRARSSAAATNLHDAVRQGFAGVDERDIELCLELDRFPFAMVADGDDGRLTLRAVPN